VASHAGRAVATEAALAAGAAARRAARAGITSRLTAGWHEAGGPATLREHLQRYGPLPQPGRNRALIDAVTAAGLTGRGGAGFPTGIKMRAVASRRGPAVVVANGMESEPASEKDKALLARAPHLVLDGAVLAASAVGADSVHVCLPRGRRRLAEAVEDAVAERERAGLDPVAIAVRALPHWYVSSEESALVHWLNGGEAKPTAVPPRPYEKGVGQRPTLVDNVETLAHVALIGRYGPAWFRRAGLPDAPGTMLVTVAGAVRAPGVYEIEAGTRVGDILAMSGMAVDAGPVLVGGYFGTWHHAEEVAGVPMAPGPLRAIGASPGTGALFPLPADCCGLAETARVLAWLAGQGAGQCGPCVFGLPAIADDFAQLAAGRPKGPVLDRLDRRLGQVGGRGACRHPDGAVRLARSALSAFAADVRSHLSRRACLAAWRGQPRQGVLPVPRPAGDGEWL